MTAKFDPPLGFDVTRMFSDMSKAFDDVSAPSVGVDVLIAIQRKNAETLAAANKIAYNGLQMVMKRQAEVLRQMVENTSALASKGAAVSSPSEHAVRQTEMTKEVFESAFANARELGDMVSRFNAEVMDVLGARFAQSLEEVKEAVEKKAADGEPAQTIATKGDAQKASSRK